MAKRNKKRDNTTETKDNTRASREGSRNNRSNSGRAAAYDKHNDYDKHDPQQTKNRSNDPVWYTRYPELARNVGTLERAYPFSQPLPLVDRAYESQFSWAMGNTNSYGDFAFPGILSLGVCPTFGPEQDNANNGINECAHSLYAFVRSKTSGAKNYDPNDMMTVVLAVAEVYALINWMERAYEYAFNYTTQNNYYPEQLVRAMGFDWSSVEGRQEKFCSYINTLIAKASQFVMPATLAWFWRRAFMYRYVYCETDNILKDQLYLFRPSYTYQYHDPTESIPEGYLEPRLVSSVSLGAINVMTIDAVYTMVAEMIEKIRFADSVGVIMGDILNAFGSQVLALSPFSDESRAVPHYDWAILHQIKNATMINGYVPTVLRQDATKAYLTTTQELGMAGAAVTDVPELALGMGHRIITADQKEIDAATLLEISRLTVGFKNLRKSGTQHMVTITCGSEVIVDASIIVNLRDPNTGDISFKENTLIQKYIMKLQTVTGCAALNQLRNFAFAPCVIPFTIDSQNKLGLFPFSCNGTYANFADEEDLDDLHRVAVMSMLAQPGINLG